MVASGLGGELPGFTQMQADQTGEGFSEFVRGTSAGTCRGIGRNRAIYKDTNWTQLRHEKIPCLRKALI